MPDILALITARGGSKGLPGKNLRPLGGRPLIAWTIHAAREAPSIGRVITSTDDPIIADVARDWGAEVPFLRPAGLARDESPHLDVVLHALDWLAENESASPDVVLLLQPTSPFRTTEDIEAAIHLALESRAPAVVSVVETHDHPYLVRTMSREGTLAPFVPCEMAYPRRQDLPPAYALNGAIYLTRCSALRDAQTFEPPGTIAYVMPQDRSLQVDTAWDFRLCELLLAGRVEATLPDASRRKPTSLNGIA